jgi:hypothetical protein
MACRAVLCVDWRRYAAITADEIVECHGGAVADVIRVRREATAAGVSGGPVPFAWHDREAVTGLFAPNGFSIDLSEEQLAFNASSPKEFLDTELRVHPGWIAARAVLEPRGEMHAVCDRTLEIF